MNSAFNDSINYIFLIVRPRAEAPEGFILRTGNSLEGRYLSIYRNSIRHQVPDRLSYVQFWKPIKERLQGCSQVYISTDGVYNQINLNVLQNPELGQYVLDEINLVFVTNTKDLLLPKNNKAKSTAQLYGRPLYSLPEHDEITYDNSHMSGKGKFIDFARHDFADLPGTQKEIDSIAGILTLNNWKTDIFLYEAANEKSLKSINSPDVLHIATHGFFMADEGLQVNSMIRSGLNISCKKSLLLKLKTLMAKLYRK